VFCFFKDGKDNGLFRLDKRKSRKKAFFIKNPIQKTLKTFFKGF
jgi:hypothetical protein